MPINTFMISGEHVKKIVRQAPIHKCFITSDWRNNHAITVIVSRRHKDGLLAGTFLLDLGLLGVRDCSWHFYGQGASLRDLLEPYMVFEECSYETAHQLIHRSIGFAANHGFLPCRKFRLAGRYIIDENIDYTSWIDISLGRDGKPVVRMSAFHDAAHEIHTLNHVLGEGNYEIDYLDRDGNRIVPEEETKTYGGILHDMKKKGIEEYTSKGQATLSIKEIQALTDLMFDEKNYSKSDLSEIENVKSVITMDPRINDDFSTYSFESDFKSRYIYDLFKQHQIDKGFDELNVLFTIYQDKPVLYHFISELFKHLDKFGDTSDLVQRMYMSLGEHTVVRLYYAEWLVMNDRADEMLDMFGYKIGLDALTTRNDIFDHHMVAAFCACYCVAWLLKNDILRAEAYYQLLFSYDDDDKPFHSYALLMMTCAKNRKLSGRYHIRNN